MRTPSPRVPLPLPPRSLDRQKLGMYCKLRLVVVGVRPWTFDDDGEMLIVFVNPSPLPPPPPHLRPFACSA